MFQQLLRAQTPTADAIARQQHGPCLLCGEELTGHDITQIASVIVDATAFRSVLALDTAVRNREWREVTGFQEWRGDADEIVYSAIRCPWSLRFFLTRLESFASLDLDDRVTNRELLSEQESSLLASEAGLDLQVTAPKGR
jgi:hypothetical protein